MERIPTVTFTPEVEANPLFFGVTMQHVTQKQGLDRARQAGIQALRHGPLSWQAVEPIRTEPPTYHWEAQEALEEELLNAAEAGIEVMLVVQFVPDWAQANPGRSCGAIRPDRLEEFAQFLQVAVERYSALPYNIAYWELFNEPDIDPSLVRPDSVFGCWGDQQGEFYGGRAYAAMLKYAYPAIKRASPSATVILGGLLLDAPDGLPTQFLNGILQDGGGDYFDILAFHAYTFYDPEFYNWDSLPGSKWLDWGGFVAGKTAFLRQLMAGYGYDKPLILNETGLAWVRPGEPTDEYQQAKADYVVQVYTRGLALGLVNVTWYGWQLPNWRQMAILGQDQEPTPAYQALSFLIDQLSQAEYSSPTSDPGLEGYTFKQKENLLLVVWSVDGQEHALGIAGSRFLQAFDLLGQPVDVAAGEDRIALSIRRPMYLQLKPGP